ncbi:MAG: transposase [Bacteroidales bacterium]|nr:MAG: transposase [Bacteroidales bacterium]
MPGTHDYYRFRPYYTIRTDRDHEIQAKFHRFVEEDKGIKHVCIKPGSPHLNGNVERSHRTDQREFCQLLTCTDDLDSTQKLEHWEHFFNFNRPQGTHNGKMPYEALKLKLEKDPFSP